MQNTNPQKDTNFQYDGQPRPGFVINHHRKSNSHTEMDRDCGSDSQAYLSGKKNPSSF